MAASLSLQDVTARQTKKQKKTNHGIDVADAFGDDYVPLSFTFVLALCVTMPILLFNYVLIFRIQVSSVFHV